MALHLLAWSRTALCKPPCNEPQRGSAACTHKKRSYSCKKQNRECVSMLLSVQMTHSVTLDSLRPYSRREKKKKQKCLLSRRVFTLRSRYRGGKACCTGAKKHHRPSAACPVQHFTGLPTSAGPTEPTRGGLTAPQAPLHLVAPTPPPSAPLVPSPHRGRTPPGASAAIGSLNPPKTGTGRRGGRGG